MAKLRFEKRNDTSYFAYDGEIDVAKLALIDKYWFLERISGVLSQKELLEIARFLGKLNRGKK